MRTSICHTEDIRRSQSRRVHGEADAGDGAEIPPGIRSGYFIAGSLGSRITRQIGPVDLPPLLYAGLLRGQAQAIFDSTTCVIGQPISYGDGEAVNVQLVPDGPGGPGGLINTAAPGEGTATVQSRSFTYLIPNGDGTFGLVSETRQHVAPVTIGAPVLGQPPLAIEVDGEFVMRLTVRGSPYSSRWSCGYSGSGLLEDIVDVNATLGNCTGGVVGQDITGQALFDNAAIAGRVVHRGPEVGRGALPADRWRHDPLVVRGVLLLTALGVRSAVRHSAHERSWSSFFEPPAGSSPGGRFFLRLVRNHQRHE